MSNRDIVLAALVAAHSDGGDVESRDARAAKYARKFATQVSEQSAISKAVDGVANAKVFTGIIEKVSLEKTSTRGIITLKTKVSKFHPDGLETVRTERTDTDPSVLDDMRHMRDDLMGHRVVVWVEMETYNEGATKVRILRHFEDLGLPREEGDSAA